MRLLSFNWLKSPADRDIIRKWTSGDGTCAYEVDLPQPVDPDNFHFLALGDSGDTEGNGVSESPQDAVARFMAEDAGLTGPGESAHLVLHTGDLVYMTGERRLYDRNFRRPYAAFLTPESTVDNLVFRVPFLPVPGNHDYYDFAGWARLLMRTPVVGSGVRALAQELFAYRVPEGGSGMGKAYMDAFMGGLPADRGPLPYQPGSMTRLPNRYYQARCGKVDFFALDSNSLDPPPPSANPTRVRREAALRVRGLETRARVLNAEVKRDQLALERWLAKRRGQAAGDPRTVAAIVRVSVEVGETLSRLTTMLERLASLPACSRAVTALKGAETLWTGHSRGLPGAGSDGVVRRLGALEGTTETIHAALKLVEACLGDLTEGVPRDDLLAAQAEVAKALKRWQDTVTGPLPADLCGRIRKLSEASLDNQRELARERRRMDYRPDDHDAGQLAWLRAALERSAAERPDAWRVVFLHHPLYTTIGNHCEHPDVHGVRDNVMPILQQHAHLVLTGHSHSFEWIRSSQMPHAGIFVTGGGGQVSLRSSILGPERFVRFKGRYDRLREAGAMESAVGGRGPDAADGADGPLYHYLRIEVTPDALRVKPVGVRRVRRGVYRREDPMPVFHTSELPPSRGGPPPREVRLLEAVEIRRGLPPRPLWV